jgi:5-methyltetrahydrofolate--homocysteine methyltransferase
MSTFEDIRNAIIAGNATPTKAGVTQALAEGADPASILNQAMIPAMAEVGKRFESGDYYVPEMLIAARAMKEGLALIKPKLVAAAVEPVGRIALAVCRRRACNDVLTDEIRTVSAET